MAHYRVTAKPKGDLLKVLIRKLREHAFASMRPFGTAITYSLENARIRGDGYATWEEEDYCSPPLAQERSAVLDEFFEELTTVEVRQGEGWREVEQLPLLFPDLTRQTNGGQQHKENQNENHRRTEEVNEPSERGVS